jgi:hypothetical protein
VIRLIIAPLGSLTNKRQANFSCYFQLPYPLYHTSAQMQSSVSSGFDQNHRPNNHQSTMGNRNSQKIDTLQENFFGELRASPAAPLNPICRDLSV